MQFAQVGRWAAIAMGIALGGTLIYGSRMPAGVEVSRSIFVNAQPEAIYPLLSDFRNGWARWNAFDDGDPAIVYAYEGSGCGTGAVQKWVSGKIGDGKMTLTAADHNRGVNFEMKMGPDGKDFRRSGLLAMSPENGGTRITWTDTSFMGKGATKRLMGPILAKMTGISCEKSLAGIKRLAEAAPAPTASVPADTTGSPAPRK